MNIVFYIGKNFPEAKIIKRCNSDNLFIFTVQKPVKINKLMIQWERIQSLQEYLDIYYPQRIIIEKSMIEYKDIIETYQTEWI